MSQPVGQIAVSVGGVSVAVVGGSASALSVATVIVAVGAAAALVFAGYSLCTWLSSYNPPQELPPPKAPSLPQP